MTSIGDIIEVVGVVLFILWMLSIPLSLTGVGLMATDFYPEEETYSYEVKAQQVFDTERVENGDVTEMEELSADEQRLLYDAFKKTDHFMGTSEVTLNYEEERLDTFNDWRTIESNGVLLLVAVNEQTTETTDKSAFQWYHNLFVYAMLYCVLGFFVIFGIPP